MYEGVLYALIALVGWGIGDFLIQKSTREIGAHRTLFITGTVASIGLLPFVYDKLHEFTWQEYGFVALLSAVVLVGALILFEAFRVGKLSVVESVVSIELPLTVLLAIAIGGELLTPWQTVLFVLVCAGVFLAASKRFSLTHFKGSLWEKGTILALFAAFFSATSNFLTGTAADGIDPFFTIWFSRLLIACACGGYMWYHREFRAFFKGVRRFPVHTIGQGIIDNIAWVSFALAMTALPISIATTISESYVILAALLGYVIGKERLTSHQKTGAVVAIFSVIILSSTL